MLSMSWNSQNPTTDDQQLFDSFHFLEQYKTIKENGFWKNFDISTFSLCYHRFHYKFKRKK